MVNDVNDCLLKAFAHLVFLLLLRVKVSDPTTDILFTTSSQLSIIIEGWVIAYTKPPHVWMGIAGYEMVSGSQLDVVAIYICLSPFSAGVD